MAEFNNYSFAAQENNPLISQMSFVHKPQLGATLFNVSPMETDIGEMFRMGLVKEETKGEETIHYENGNILEAPYLNQSDTVGDVYGEANGSGADPALFDGLDYVQLAETSHSPVDGADARKYSYPRPGDLIQFKNMSTWRVQGKRETVAGQHRLYITPVNALQPSVANSVQLVGSTYGGDQIAVIGTAFEEGTWGMKKGIIPVFKTYKSYLQEFNDFHEVTDFAMRDETYPLKDPSTGKTINFVYNKALADLDVRFALKEAFGLFLTPKDDGTLTAIQADGSAPVTKTTSGYIPTLIASAEKIYHDDATTLALFDDIERVARKNYQGRQMLLQYGSEFGKKLRDVITKFGADGGIIYNRKAIDLGIRMIDLGDGWQFGLKELKILNHPAVTGIDGFPYPQMFVISPTDKTKDPKTGIMNNAFQCIFKQIPGGGNRGHYKIWKTGALADVPTDTQQVLRYSIASRKGIQIVGAQRFILGLAQ